MHIKPIINYDNLDLATFSVSSLFSQTKKKIIFVVIKTKSDFIEYKNLFGDVALGGSGQEKRK